MSASAFRATYSDWKLVKTRGVVQVVFEVPVADAGEAYDVLGGMPNSGSEQWFGIAAISAARSEQVESKSTARTKRDWPSLSAAQQSGIRCDDIAFTVFLQEEHPDNWHESMSDPAECVRLICGVQSRGEFARNPGAEQRWRTLDDQFQAWKALEHA